MKIKRDGLRLLPVDDYIPAEGSADVPVTVQNDDTFSGYVIEPHVGYVKSGTLISLVRTYSSNQFTIPKESFEQPGQLTISLKLIKDSEELMTNQLSYNIWPTPNAHIIGEEPNWHTALDLANSYMNQQYIERLANVENSVKEIRTRLDSIELGNTSVLISVEDNALALESGDVSE